MTLCATFAKRRTLCRNLQKNL